MIDIYHIHNNKQVLRHITIHLESYKQLDHSQTDIRLTFFPQQSWKSIPFILFLGLNTGTPLYCQYQMHEDTHTHTIRQCLFIFTWLGRTSTPKTADSSDTLLNYSNKIQPIFSAGATFAKETKSTNNSLIE